MAGADLLVVAQGLASLLAGLEAAGLCREIRGVLVEDLAERRGQARHRGVAVVDVEIERLRWLRRRPRAWLGAQVEHLVDASIGIGTVGPEPVAQRDLEAREEERVREHEVLDRVDRLGHRQVREVVVVLLAQHLLHVAGVHVAGTLALRDLGDLLSRILAVHQHVQDALLVGSLLRRHVRAGRADRVDEAADVVAEHVVLRVGVAGGVDRLRMGFEDVVRLEERLGGCLPVGRQPLADVDLDVSIGEIPVREVLGQHAEVLLERRCHQLGSAVVEVDEHESAPQSGADLRQPEFVGVDVGEVPLAREVDELAVERPRPSVERAAQFRAVADRRRRLELRAAVQTRVVERLDAAVGTTHDHRGSIADVVDVVVAGLGDVLLAARPLPGARPHVVVLVGGVRG